MGAKVCPNQEASWSPFCDLPALPASVFVSRAALLRPAGLTRSHRRQAAVAHRTAHPDIHEGRAADHAALLSELPSSRHAGADVADDVTPKCGRGRASIKTKVTSREMPPWHIDRSIGEYSNDPSLSDAEVATIARWVDGGAPEGNRADAPPAKVFPPSTEWTYGEPDLDRAHGEGLQDSRERPGLHSRRARRSEADRGSLREVGADHSRRVAGPCTTRTSTSICPKAPTPTGLGLGMGSNVGNSMDLIEYGAGNDADIFPDGTTKILKKGSIFRFEGHYHPYGEETVRSHARRHQVLSEGLQARARRHLASHSHRASATTGC